MDGYRTMTENAGSKISCHYVHFTSTEDIYLKSSIPGEISSLCVTGSNVALLPPRLPKK